MEDNLEQKLDFKKKLINFYNLNKFKVFTFLIIITIATILFLLLKINNQKKNIEISERYVEAGIYLSSNKLEEAKNIYEEIILSKNKFYSLLSLNNIVEKNLIKDENKILDYFTILEKLNYKDELQYLIILKKSFFFLKTSKDQEGEKLLDILIKKNSKLNNLAKEIRKKKNKNEIFYSTISTIVYPKLFIR
mgnify:CR=1 FL=1